ncbi:MAG: winged helix-turn-helix domain-containing protein [Candidatus Bathyarchaeia archaeon]
MSVSPLSSQLKKTGDILKESASSQIIDYTTRFEAIKDIYEGLLKDLIVQRFNAKEASQTAKAFFGSNKVGFAAIDGTEYSRPMFDLLIFFGASYATKGTVEFKDEGPIITYSTKASDEAIGISSCIPMYVNEVVEAEQAFMELAAGDAKTISKPLTDETVINNATIASWIMTFSEFYLAYKLAADSGDVRVLLMDRSLSTTQGSLIYDTRRRGMWKTCAIVDCDIGGVRVDKNDLAYNRFRMINQALRVPPARGDYLRYTTVYLLEKKPMSFEEICSELGVSSPNRRERVRKLLGKAIKEEYVEEHHGIYELAPRYRDSWTRVKALVEAVSNRIFGGRSTENPLQIDKDGNKCWVTTLDIAFLTLFSFCMLIEECWKKNILLLGITKDTTARDFKTHLIPICLNNKVWQSTISQQNLEKAPNTDRMLLQYASIYNQEVLHTPWSLIEYDSAFRTAIPELERHRLGYVSGAVRNRVSPERTFLKSYIQLSEAVSDPRLRSNVLFIDRLAYPTYDLREETVLHLKHNYGGAEEPFEPILFRNCTTRNELQNMIVVMLKAMANSNIPEVFGHNMPLYIADNIAKWHNSEVRKIIDSTANWIASNQSLRQFVFYMSTFRERRDELESGRRAS